MLKFKCYKLLLSLYSFFVFFRECAELLFDLQTVPGRYFFELLSKFTSDEQEQEKFIEFTTSEVKILNTKVDSNRYFFPYLNHHNQLLITNSS